MYFLLEPGDNRETIVKEAILLLNESGKFGNLQFYKATFLSGKLDYVSLILVTDEKKNRNFWGKGLSGGTIRRRRRRK